MNYINDDIKINFKVSRDIFEMMQKCELLDKDDNYGAYENYANFLVNVLCKEAYVQNHITKQEWETIEMRYQL